MSDQGFDPQQPPTQPPAPPAAAYPPPPAYGQPPAQQPPAYPPPDQPPPAYPPQEQPPAKKGKGGVIAVVIALIVLCGLISCAALGITLYTVRSSSNTTSDIEQAEAHFDAAVTAVEVANASLVSLSKDSPSAAQITEIVSETDASLRTARDEVAAAGAIAAQWEESQGKADYIAGLAATTATLNSLQDLVAYVNTAGGMLAKAKQAGKEATSGNRTLSSAIKDGNSSKYSSMRTKAQAAQTHYVKAALLFREAHALDKSAGLDKAAKYVDYRKKQADVVVRMAAEGAARRYKAYNADIKKMKSYSSSAEKVGEPAIVSDSDWAAKRLALLETAITESSTQADELRQKALQELGFTE